MYKFAIAAIIAVVAAGEQDLVSEESSLRELSTAPPQSGHRELRRRPDRRPRRDETDDEEETEMSEEEAESSVGEEGSEEEGSEEEGSEEEESEEESDDDSEFDIDDFDFRGFFGGNKYFELPARAKHAIMLEHLEESEETIEYFYADMADVFKQVSNRTTCTASDEFLKNKWIEGQEPAETEKRKKLLHTKGFVGSVELRHDPERHDAHPYTGLFQGADFGIVRLTDAGFFLEDHDAMKTHSPSVALKFFVDGRRSENLLGMVSFDGIEDEYFFAADFTNHPPRFTNECMKKTLERKFAEASQFAFSNGNSPFSGVDQAGNVIPTADRVFPYELIMVPNREFFERPENGEYYFEYFDNYFEGDWHDDDVPYPLLFTLQARAEPGDEELLTIGEIHLNTPLLRSTFGDERLFFRHENFSRDLKTIRTQGDKDRLKAWRRATPKVPRSERWGTTPINELPEDADEAMEIIEAGVADQSCPFAWLLA